MDIRPVDITTPLNVEMLKELRATLEALNEQQRMETLSIARPDPDEREMIATRKAATFAVMKAIKAFCSPVMLCSSSCPTPPVGSSCDTCGNTEIPPVLVTIESLGDSPRMQEEVMLGKYPESTFADLSAGVVWSCGKCGCVGFNVQNS